MKLENIRVIENNETSGQRTKKLEFSIAQHNEQRKDREVSIRTKSMMAKIGLCAAAVVLALVLRLTGVDKPTMAVDSQEQSEGETETLGALHFVSAAEPLTIRADKWPAPVAAIDVELILDSGVVRYTSAVSTVTNCIEGEVAAVGEDERYGSYVRLKHEDGIETIYYGIENREAEVGQIVHEGESLGTVKVGDSVYLCILKGGAPQNPVDYVSVNIGG